MTRHVVARVGEIAPGGRKRVEIDGRGVIVFNVKGEFFAVSETCPHKGGSLAKGIMTGLVQSNAPGEYRYTRQGEIIRCPWHQWEFDVRTGRSYCDPRRMRLMKFDVKVEPGAALVEGPYTAETFKVEVEADYVVVEVPG
jgi:3-phenylpropionate/trans-cinnamate dioxygenase ferredoxin subunit